MAGYTPVFDSVFNGTLCGRWPMLPVWLSILPLADWRGHIDMTPQAISAMTGWPIDLLNQGIAALTEPDPDSRSPDEEGRRLVPLDPARRWGWRVVNIQKYRRLASGRDQSADQIADGRNAAKVKRYKDRHRQTPADTTGHQNSYSDTNSYTDSNKNRNQESRVVEPSSTPTPTEPKPLGEIFEVFEHWRSVHRHPHAKLDEKRRRVIAKALEHYASADLCRSLSGYLNSPHHMGQNEKATVYDDLELLLRDSKHIDAGLKLHAEPPRTDLSAKTRANVAAIADWKPPELRNASG